MDSLAFCIFKNQRSLSTYFCRHHHTNHYWIFISKPYKQLNEVEHANMEGGMNRLDMIKASPATISWSPTSTDEITHSSFDEYKMNAVGKIEFIDCGIKKESECSGESDDKISAKVKHESIDPEFIDCGIKKESECSGESDDKISAKVNYDSIDPDVRKENNCSATGNIKLERNTDDSFDIKYEDFEYDTHSHTLAENHTIHLNNDSPDTSTQSMIENISMEVSDIKNLDTNQVTVEKRRVFGESKITCNICHKSFTKMSSLNRHMRIVHKKEKPFFCHICPSSFSQKCHLSQHVKSIHEREKTIFL